MSKCSALLVLLFAINVMLVDAGYCSLDKYGQRRFSRIETALSQMSDRDVRNGYISYAEARTLENDKKYDAAIKRFTAVSKFFGDKGPDYQVVVLCCDVHVAQCYELNGKAAESQERFKRCLSEAKKFAESLSREVSSAKTVAERLGDSCKLAEQLDGQGKLHEALQTLESTLDAVFEKGWFGDAPESWKESVARAIKRSWLQGDKRQRELMLSLKIKRDGTVLSCRITDKQGQPIVSNTAEAAIHRALPIKCLPPGVGSAAAVQVFLDTLPVEEYVLSIPHSETHLLNPKWCAVVMLQQVEPRDELIGSCAGESESQSIVPEGLEISDESDSAMKAEEVSDSEQPGTLPAESLEPDSEEANVGGDAGFSKPTTIISTGRTTKMLPGVVAKIGPRLSRLIVAEQKSSGFAASVLFSKPLAGGPSRQLFGDLLTQARELAVESERDRRSYEREQEHTYQWTDATFSSSLTVTSIYQNLVSLSIYAEPFYPGAAHPQHQSTFSTFRLGRSSLAPVNSDLIPSEAAELANEQLLSLPEFQRADNEPFGFGEFRVVPYRFGAAVEFLNASRVHANPTVLYSRVPVATNLLPDSTIELARFKFDHPNFVEWSKVSWLSLSPDSKAMTFCQNEKLYWKDLSGKSIFLRDLGGKCVRGIQWFDRQGVDPRDLSAVGIK